MVEDKRLEHIKYQAEHNIRNMSSPEEILAIVSELIEARKKIKDLNHVLTDAEPVPIDEWLGNNNHALPT